MSYREERIEEFINLDEKEVINIHYATYDHILHNETPWCSFKDYLKNINQIDLYNYKINSTKYDNYDEEYENDDEEYGNYDRESVNYDIGYDNYDMEYDNYNMEYDNYDMEYENMESSGREDYHTDEEYDIVEDFYDPCYKKFNYY